MYRVVVSDLSSVCQEVPHLECRVLAEVTVGEDEQKLCAVRGLVGRLQRVWGACREVPQITLILSTTGVNDGRGQKLRLMGTYDSANKVLATGVDGSHLDGSLQRSEFRLQTMKVQQGAHTLRMYAHYYETISKHRIR